MKLYPKNLIHFFAGIPLVSMPIYGALLFIIAYISFVLSNPNRLVLESVSYQIVGNIAGILLAVASCPKVFVRDWFSKLFTIGSSKATMRIKRFDNYIFSSLFFLYIVNFLLNSNFSSIDPSLRFTSVKFSALQILVNGIGPIQALLLLVTPVRSKSFPLTSYKWQLYLIQLILSFFVGSSKNTLIFYLLPLYLTYGLYLWPRLLLTVDQILISIIRLRLNPRKLFWSFVVILIAFIAISLYLLYVQVDLLEIIARLTGGFDQLTLLSQAIDSRDLDPDVSVTTLGQPLFPLVWFKSFIRPIFPWLYDLRFDNYTEFLQYIVLNITTDSYSSTGWAPNNSLFTDIFLVQPNLLFIHLIISVLVSFIVMKVILCSFLNLLLSDSTDLFLRVKRLVVGSYFFAPFVFPTDTQYFFTSIISSYAFLLLVASFIYCLTGECRENT